jgi:ADP-ribosyl-[dinitrogen reductase] hydrolase
MDKIKGSLLGSFIGDALSMPVHWYYNQLDIKKDFGGWISNYEAPQSQHPTSIMHAASTGGQGRGNQSGDIIGSLILHDKKSFWGKEKVHYHQGMKKGMNTLNSHVTRLLLRYMSQQKEYTPLGFLEEYIKFMTTPQSHPDTYAESYHREFFKNVKLGKSPLECAGDEGHDTASVGGLVTVPVVALYYFYKGTDRPDYIKACLQHISTTHKSSTLNDYSKIYLNLFFDILSHPVHPIPIEELKNMINLACKSLPEPFDVLRLIQEFPENDPLVDTKIVGRMFSPACYIQDSLPSTFYFAAKYCDKGLDKALLANANVGGDNCHRGSVLGALLGAALGEKIIPPAFISGLYDGPVIIKEIEKFQTTLLEQQNNHQA